jgi:hypothetical protein
MGTPGGDDGDASESQQNGHGLASINAVIMQNEMRHDGIDDGTCRIDQCAAGSRGSRHPEKEHAIKNGRAEKSNQSNRPPQRRERGVDSFLALIP